MSTEDATRAVRVIEPPHELAPPVRLRRIAEIRTYEVMEAELRDLEKSTGEESVAAAFCTGAAGALVGLLVGWPATDATTARWGVWTALVGLCVVVAGWFAVKWATAARSRRYTIDDIRSRGTAELKQLASSPTARRP